MTLLCGQVLEPLKTDGGWLTQRQVTEVCGPLGLHGLFQ